MARRKVKTKPEEVAEDEVVVDTSNDLDVIETLPQTVVKPTEVNNIAVDIPNNNDVMLPRSASRYVPPLR